jgi:hypothetical protein
MAVFVITSAAPLLRRPKHAVQDGDTLGGRADVEHDRPGVPLDRPGGPLAALGLDSDQGAQFFLGARLGAENRCAGRP